MARSTLIIVFAAIMVFAGIDAILAQDPVADGDRRISWKTGGRFREALNKKTRFTASGDLASNLNSLSRASSVALLMDRELNPNQVAKFPDELMPLGQIIEEAVESIGASSGFVGSFIYVATPEKLNRFRILRDIESRRVAKLDKTLSAKWKGVSEMAWPFLSNPADTITSIAGELGYQLSGMEAVEHDLWAAKRLPRMPKWEQLVFLLNCLDCYFVVDESKKEIRVAQLSDDQVLIVEYSKSQHSKIVRLLKESKLPDTELALQNRSVLVRGPLRSQLRIAEQLRPTTKYRNQPVKSGAKDVFDLNTRAQRGAILASIAKNRGVKLRYDPALADQLKETVPVQVKRVSINELISAVLEGTGFKFRLTPTNLEIFR